MGEYAIKLKSVNSGTVKVGAKAKRLGDMLSGGLPIPAGFVLTTEAYVKYVRHNRILSRMGPLLEESHTASTERLMEISAQLQGIIANGTMPDFIERAIKEEYQDLSIGSDAKEIGGAALDLIRAGRDNVFVAVRPSPSSSGMPSANFSGQMKAVLSIRSHQQIAEAVKECWASLFSPRAMLYRRRKRVRDMPVMGVVVQKSIEAEKSGFAYTCLPETNDAMRMVVEGSWGFGDSIATGAVTPDEFVMSKETGELEGKSIRKKLWMNRRNEMTGRIAKEPVFRERVGAELLDPKELSKLHKLAVKTENGFGGHPQEIEWCEERGRFFILDSLPMPDYGVSQEGEPPQGDPLVKGTCAFRGLARGRVRILSSMSGMERVGSGDILVTGMTTPEMLPVIERVSGIITDEGSRSCHAALVSREFGIPCMVCAANATATLKDGQEVVFDASSGAVFPVREPPPASHDHAHYQHPQVQGIPQAGAGIPANPPGIRDVPVGDGIPPGEPQAPMHTEGSRDSGQPIPRGLGEDVTATGIKAIVSMPGNIGNSPGIADGVGLVRGEHVITETGKHPFHLVRQDPEALVSALLSGLGKIARAFYPKPVWYRSIDIRTDEFRELEGGEHEPSENNPIMGWHGIRRSMDQPGVLEIEIGIIKRLHQEGMDNVLLGLPFISGVEELRKVRKMCDFPLKIGIMVETPAAGLEMENLCKEGIAFAAIGLNDLTQLTLGVDRDNSRVSKLYSELDPAVVNLLKHVLRTCRKYSVETSVYGDFVSDPGIVESMVGLGVGSVSADTESLESIKSVISRAERKLILENLRNRPGS